MHTLKESCHSKTTHVHVVSALAEKLYYYVQWAGHFVCKKDFYIKRSHFESFLLLHTLSGCGELNYQGKTHALVPGSLVLIDCRELHEYYPAEDGWDFQYLHFYGANSEELCHYVTRLHGFAPMTAPHGTQNAMADLCRMTAQSREEALCSARIYSLLMEMISAAQQNPQRETTPLWVNQAIRELCENYTQEMDVEALAKKFHFSRCYFSTLFKKHTGFSPHQYLMNYRHAQARRLLCSTALSVSEIGRQCGFHNTSAFIRAFKKQENISPLAFRKNAVF